MGIFFFFFCSGSAGCVVGDVAQGVPAQLCSAASSAAPLSSSSKEQSEAIPSVRHCAVLSSIGT